MRICVVDGSKVENKEALHDILADSLQLPSWYGRNLDALYDCLTELEEETEIRLLNKKDLETHLGNYAKSLEKVLHAAAAESQRVHWTAEG